ncbi:MAG: 50S ribosomal protein L21 [Citromicrobium sp.]|uniref:50S ribosomal protein L21 n=1 Tax=uncultured Henriciella sp. TaxID=1608424 RepID=UPI000C54FBC2|nr:50S ribosomal protein L21 [Henriciella sp.]MBF32801.1 50S ribosomal protein L21 [Hyphomonadaceae bacterium]MBL4793905.1 50S ribosomal protein L21 [Citromicrobium sp.]|tara:strand:- start:34 stop:747 length:714 start_codon:yes stop_codon:yes gene_type:complete
MFAVIKTGGKQYKVAEGDQIVVEKLAADAGADVTFDVLMLGDGKSVTLGSPVVDGASVVGEIAAQQKGDKKLIMKKRQRNTYRRKKGHRQLESVVTITSILTDGKKAPAKKAAAPKKEEAPKAEAKPAEKAEAPAAKKEAAPKTEAAPKAEAKAARAKTDERGRLEKADGKADDLKKISGVGPAMEKKLNAAGIFHFWQVADLNKTQAQELDDEAGLGGRIERDEWVKQAKQLAKDA